ncbi:MAG: DNA-formamidopyrimidine glycosylase family protein [Actinomycetota bacterium]|nr:formamidopyrimidine-DNA glycosylase [Acidobacteriota bacterium]MEC8999691.1 DNA-formamidopyrimidine glycosylase family protein [Actinomycetota bacterium]MEC9394664.1 DNA-formamidopyrimidine glycosylase family protein [Actinomycetota bacterium]MEC9467803.1 DNA-formamidopyrimidine glycosylase family protein [Actinomycetota bacterium]MED5220048.1 DNA-formamidopyrimidine glycosylase family protein [Actinomycetota bacterium]
MPEILEAESYRRLAETVVGRTVTAVEVPDPLYPRGGIESVGLAGALVGRRITATRRHGKVVLLDSGGPTLGLRFGMTGRLFVDGRAAIEYLKWGGRRSDPSWLRFALLFRGGGQLWIDDPRRLGSVELAPDLSGLGPDAWSLRVGELRGALAGGRGPLKARLLDQARVAGLGNLLVDEIAWRSGLSPLRPAGSLDEDEVRRLHRTIRRTLDQMDRRGGSHTGDLFDHRRPGGVCPRDGAPLCRSTVGGRTSWWCPGHQR